MDDQADLLGHVLVSRISKGIRHGCYLQHVEVEGVVASEVVGPIVDLSCVRCEGEWEALDCVVAEPLGEEVDVVDDEERGAAPRRQTWA